MIQWLEQRAQPQVIRNRKLVHVERRRSEDGTLFYRKRFFADLHDEGWLGRENRILLWFAIRDPYPQHLVRLKRVNFLAGGRLDVLDTFDAGPSLKEWGEVGMPDRADTSLRIRPFSLCTHWWHLANASLRALDELHGLGLVHADIKEDNLCMPFDAGLAAQGQIKLGFNELRLIDVTYSILPNVPLTLPLPLDPLPDSYQAQLLQFAIAADEKLGRPDHANRLDWRIDLFSLGSMLERLLDPQPALGWNYVLHGKGLKLIAQLKAHDSPDSAHFDTHRQRPHLEYLTETQLVLNSLPEPVPWSIGKKSQSAKWVGEHAPIPANSSSTAHAWHAKIFANLQGALRFKYSRQTILMGLITSAGIAFLLYLFYRTLAK